MVNVKNKRILLVGASGVLGSKYAESLHKNGAKLIMSDLKNSNFTKVIKKIKKQNIYFAIFVASLKL